MPRIRHLVAIFAITLAAALLTGVSPANAVGNKKCDTNSPQWNVDMCARSNASPQTDGSGYRLDNVRVWATGNPDTLEACPAFVTQVSLYRSNGELIAFESGEGCEHTDYAKLLDFGGQKFGPNAYLKIYVQMYDNFATDPPPAWITMDAVS